MTEVADSVMSVRQPIRGALVCGSHGGAAVAKLLIDLGASAVIVNDGGVGRDRAGIAALDIVAGAGISAATISHLSARIGDAADMLDRGLISHINDLARIAGLTVGMSCKQAVRLLEEQASPPVSALRRGARHRPLSASPMRRVILRDGPVQVWGIDSASLARPADLNHFLVTGSHGAAPGGQDLLALKVDACAAVFNDAGGGADDAGFGRLAVLDRRGIPAVTVSHQSARIGDARSTWHDGIVSAANVAAFTLGVCIGMSVPEVADRVIGYVSSRPNSESSS